MADRARAAGTPTARLPWASAVAGPAGLAAIFVSALVTFTVAVLGPSVVEPRLPGGGPPFDLAAHPGPHLVITLSAVAVIAGACGLALVLFASGRGWSVTPRALLISGFVLTVALALMPPFGSADHLNYAAYGRMVVLGHNPYTTGAVNMPGDPIADTVEAPWREEVSVYGPLASAVQAFASWIGGDSVRLTIFVLALLNAAAFILAGWLLYRYARDPAGRLRAVLLWTLNPLLLYQLVAGLHVDTLGIALSVAALVALRRTELGSGVLLGLAVAVKATVGLALGGLLWVRRSRRRALAWVLGGFVVTAGVAYAAGGPHVLDQTRSAARMVSLAVPWHLVAPHLDGALGHATSRQIISVATVVLTVVLAILLLRSLAGPADDPDGSGEAFRISAALNIAWLFASSYVLPWYDGVAYALLAPLPRNRFDGVIVARTLVVSLAYLPARVVPLPADLGWLLTVGRAQIAPWLMLGILAALVIQSRRGSRPRAAAQAPAPPAA
ncbi:MAG TPA: polyprenol phosphomannose-dependent alpha 1,6 mannosyltransferase MptB [Streptosporangiaceae bacterium]